MGEWSLLGFVTNLKTSLNLGSRSKIQNSALCLRVPGANYQWEIDLNNSLTIGDVLIGHTQDFCPYWEISHNVSIWKGIFIKISKNGDSHDINLVKSDEKTEYLGSAKMISRVTISTSPGYMEININNDTEIAKRIEIPIVSCIYPIVLVKTDIDISSISIFRMKMTIDNCDNLSETCQYFDNMNRRILSNRNSVSMRVPSRHANKVLLSKPDNLSQEDRLKSIAKILADLNMSLSNAIKPNEIKELVELMIRKRLSKVEKKLHKRIYSYQDIRQSFRSILLGVDSTVRNLRDQVIESLEETKTSSVLTLGQFLNITKPATLLQNHTKKYSNDARSQWIPTFLYVIAFIELFSYVAFFFVKRKKTKGFKKYD